MIARITSATPYCAANPGTMARPWLAAIKPSDTLAMYQSQESNAITRRLAICGIEADIGKAHADTYRHAQHPDLRADYVFTNPPFNDSDWFRNDDVVRWQFGNLLKGNANFARMHH